MKHKDLKIILLAITTLQNISVNGQVCTDHYKASPIRNSMFEWKGCYGIQHKVDIEKRFGFEKLFEERVQQKSGYEKWKESLPELACRCAQKAADCKFNVFALRFPSFCYGRETLYSANRSARSDEKCIRENYTRSCDQLQSLCIGVHEGVSIYSLVENFTSLKHYYTCNPKDKHPIEENVQKIYNYKSGFSKKDAKASLLSILASLNGTLNVDEILSLIKDAIKILKRREIYQDFKVFKECKQPLMDILSRIVDGPYKDIWMKSQKIHLLVTLVEDVARTLLLSLESAKQSSGTFYYPTRNIDIIANLTNGDHAALDFNETAIYITSSESYQAGFGASAILYRGIEDLFPHVKQRSSDFNESAMKVASPVVSLVAMHDGTAVHSVNGTIRFRVGDQTNNEGSRCAYWHENKSMSLGGVWSTRGLHLIDTFHNNNTNDTYFTCQTNHLTNFAILMETSEYKISSSHKVALEIITYVGCTLSLCCLLLTISTLPFIRLREIRFKIHLHLCIALAAAQIVFLAGINAVDKKIPCMIVAILLHYFYTVAFLWMLIEGIHLYQKVVVAYEKKAIKKKYYFAIAWGTPVIIVSVSAAVEREGYGTHKGCWLSLEKGFRWAFIGPALFVMIVNVIILTRVLTVMVNLRNDPLKKQKYTKIRAALKGVVILLPLLGLTWLFGLMSVNFETIVFQYLFSIFNSLQGAFIFFFNYVMNKEVRASFRRTLQRTTTTSL